MFDFIDNLTLKVSNWALQGKGKMTDKEFIEKEIVRWKNSPKRIMQIKGHLYYDNEHDILMRKRQVIGADGKLETVTNLPNNHIIDNQYGKLVNQKANYLLGQPITFSGENDKYTELVKNVLNDSFMAMLKEAGKDMMNGGVAWLYPYFKEDGSFAFRSFPAYEILPFWKDSQHTQLEMAVRLYLVMGYDGNEPTVIQKVEIFDLAGVHRYILDGEKLIPDVVNQDEMTESYVVNQRDGVTERLNWTRIPLIPLKYNKQESPLLKKVKNLQDGINIMLSDFQNNMEENTGNTILVLKNYDGEDLGQFRRNLSVFRAVKVSSREGVSGGVDTLEVTVNSENYKTIVDIFKKALIENGMGYDAKDDRLSGNPNEMNIQSMYSDIDLDANDMEMELQAAFKDILWFVNTYLANTGQGSYDNEDITVIFNRDILINESEAIDNCAKSVGIISDETIVAQHPWIDDPQEEMKRLEKQKQKQLEEQKKQFEATAYDPFDSDKGDDE